MEPILFQPLIKQARWGGRKLGQRLGKLLGDATNYAESWEICDHGDDQSVVAEGPLAGKTLTELVQQYAEELFGNGRTAAQFPLLIKYLDCNDTLSVQVHPDDELAEQFMTGENGKTEAWVVIDAEPGSCIYAGLKAGIDRAAFEQAVERDQVAECLHQVTPRAGDCFFIPAGTIHALGRGVLVAEIQQSSDLTFRIHDWNWVDAEGIPRQLHLQESLRCIDFESGPVSPVIPKLLSEEDGTSREQLVQSSFFAIERFRIADECSLTSSGQCRVLMTLRGSLRLETADTGIECIPGTTVLIPATSPEIRLHTTSESPGEFLLAAVP
ncbi:type I phosphomannose isomerase catalytic subunit [Rubinisphaera margarita]|uniref:type I phosphomannose isomerase catalytic subunit n=1 Tax=Rubinisphaera margarita TaxID=2909586 RepID=UPI001EE79A4D|nr:type I phosphomannose isomerase catalytic subunit [Rubinisphaera margarita]MCG6154440.1 class I mannose-6-phosphate isomerase [Rubinisphaera margarita]